METISDGEGGEAGLGMTKLVPSVSVPALRSDQFARVLIGNTVRFSNRFASHFDPGDDAEGWVMKYRPTAMAHVVALISPAPGRMSDD